MLPKKARISRKIHKNIGRGRTKTGRFFSLREIESPESRFSVVISKKILASAVDRNHLRRKIYALLAPFVGKPGLRVLMGKKGVERANSMELREDISQLV